MSALSDLSPIALAGWQLMEPGELIGLWESIGLIKTDTGEWAMGRGMSDLRMYLLTDLPHPHAPGETAIFVRDAGSDFSALADHLLKENS